MIVTHKINMNLDRAGVMPMVDVVQGDSNTREIQFCLYSGGQAWDIPADAKVLVRYRKANGSGGTYDTLPDGKTASVVSGNTVTVTLAPQALSAAGIVTMAVTLVKDDAELSTFAVLINVTKNPTAETNNDGNYVSVSGLLTAPESAKVGQYLAVKSIDENGKVKEVQAVNAPSGGGGSGGYVDLTGYATEQWVQEGYQQKGNYLTEVPEGYAKIDDIPKNAADIGALPDNYKPPNQTAAQVGADPVGTAENKVSAHNASDAAHADIRLLISQLSTKVNNFLDSDDTTLDALSKLITAIENNAGTIEQLTAGKISTTDIINNLVTNVANKPLSAAQGVVLKGLIDNLATSLSGYQPKGDYALNSAIPTKVSQLQNDKNYLTEHQDISGKLDASKLPEAINSALAQAKASGEFDGEDGLTPHIGANGNWFIGDTDTGVKAQGGDGRGIQSIKRTSGTGAAGTTDTYTITYTDGNTSTYGVYNGKDGEPGKAATIEIANVTELEYGAAPTVTEQSGSTAQSRKYVIGIPEGKPGYTPQREIDYWTPADQEAIVQQVVAALGTPVFGRVDADNNIILTGELADGTYTIKYEDAAGNVTTVGTLEHDADAPNYTNQIPISTDTDGSIYNGIGYKEKTRGNSSGAPSTLDNPDASNPVFFTGFIPAKIGDVILLKNCYMYAAGDGTLDTYGGGPFGLRSGLYNSSKEKIEVESWGNLNGNTTANKQDKFSDYTRVDANGAVATGTDGRIYEFTVAYAGTAYIRLTLAADRDNGYTPADAIVTVNEEIID